MYVDGMVTEFHFFNRITKKKNIAICENVIYVYYTHTTSHYIQFLIGGNFCGDLHLDIDVIRCSIKLKVKVSCCYHS